MATVNGEQMCPMCDKRHDDPNPICDDCKREHVVVLKRYVMSDWDASAPDRPR